MKNECLGDIYYRVMVVILVKSSQIHHVPKCTLLYNYIILAFKRLWPLSKLNNVTRQLRLLIRCYKTIIHVLTKFPLDIFYSTIAPSVEKTIIPYMAKLDQNQISFNKNRKTNIKGVPTPIYSNQESPYLFQQPGVPTSKFSYHARLKWGILGGDS